MPNVHSCCIGLRKFEVLLNTVNVNAYPRPQIKAIRKTAVNIISVGTYTACLIPALVPCRSQESHRERKKQLVGQCFTELFLTVFFLRHGV